MNTLTIILAAHLFTLPLEVPTRAVALLWALPICLSIALVYKALKLETFTLGVAVREVLLLFATIIGFLILIAVVLLVIARVAGL
jgi:hypothetical protein